MNHLGTVELIVDNEIKLRRYEMSDASDMLKNWASNPSVTEWLTWASYSDLGTAQNRIKGWINNYCYNTFYQWVIAILPLNEAVGSVSVHFNDDEAEISYCLGMDYWNRKITSRCIRKVIQFLNEKVGAKRICVEVAEENTIGQKLALSCGLKYDSQKVTYNDLTHGRCKMKWYYY